MKKKLCPLDEKKIVQKVLRCGQGMERWGLDVSRSEEAQKVLRCGQGMEPCDASRSAIRVMDQVSNGCWQ